EPMPTAKAEEPVRRRRIGIVLACGAAVLAAAAVTTALLATRSGPEPADAAPVSVDSLGIFDPGSGRPVGQIPVGASPGDVAAGDGSLWVANVDARTVTRVDPAKRTVVDTIPVGNGPAGIAYGGG